MRTIHTLLLATAVLATPISAAAATTSPPFREAVRAGDILFLSGQLGTAPDGSGLVPGGLPAEARQAMGNIGAILARHGLGFGDLVKCVVMLADISRWSEFNAVYLASFGEAPLPARSAFGTNGLALGAAVEIECTAHSPASPKNGTKHEE
ncbi:RidA family protein [Sphingosinicella sp.]|jgi:2-iminobutanoate/2-iminopropanoate deaminase|uniref:RidA family protein n=1 Tax=Sphingosinicella sp. TaxID=1917971 RepID=UPI0026045A67|nr:RidA family protein [Sphingosinicella sp.]